MGIDKSYTTRLNSKITINTSPESEIVITIGNIASLGILHRNSDSFPESYI